MQLQPRPSTTIWHAGFQWRVPQNSIPQQLYGMDEFHATNFMRGYNVALNKLDDPNCVRAISELGGDLLHRAKSVLQQLFDNHAFRYDPSVTAIAQTTPNWTHSVIRLSDQFFAGDPGQTNRHQADMEKFFYGELLAKTILHELAHALGALAHPDQKDNPDPKGIPTAEYNDKIIEGCFGNVLNRRK